jgi:hypothetical protein
MIKELVKIANKLDDRGLVFEASSLDRIIRLASELVEESLIKTSSVDIRRENVEWKEKWEKCYDCLQSEEDIEYYKNADGSEGWAVESPERFAELKKLHEGATPVDLCRSNHDGERSRIIDGIGYDKTSSMDPEDYVNLANGNARMIFNMIGVPLDEYGMLEVSHDDVPSVIRKINYLLNMPSETERFERPGSEGRSSHRVMTEREDGVAEIGVRRGPLVIDGGTSGEYIVRTLERVREIFISAADAGDGVVVV